MSSPLLIAPLLKKEGTSAVTSSPVSYVYTAPCEHHPSKGQTDYLVNDMFPKLTVSSSFSVLYNHSSLFSPILTLLSHVFFSVTHTSSRSFCVSCVGWLDPEFGLPVLTPLFFF